MEKQEIQIELKNDPIEMQINQSDTIIRNQENVIESISVNGVEQEVDKNKNVNISVPTKLSDLENDNNTVQDDSYIHTDNNYTNAEKSKLAELENYDDSEIKEDIDNLNTDITDLNNNKADKTELPTKTSDLTNDNGFIDKNINNLTNYTLKTSTGSLIDLEINQSTYIITLNLKDQDGNVISTDNIDLPLESVVVGGRYDSTNRKIVLTLENGNTVDIPVGDLVTGLQTEITSTNKLASDLVDDTNSGNKFVTASEKQTWNNKQDTLTAGTGIDITNGVISNTQTTAEWGNITGTLANQTDLQAILNSKASQSSVDELSALVGELNDQLETRLGGVENGE